MPPVSPPPLPAPSDGPVWYGNIQYLLNISLLGSLSCILIFLLLKLRSDHHRLPSPSSLLTQLLAVHRSTPSHVALRCGADAAQFLLLERSVSTLLLSLSLLSLLFVLPLNLHSSSPTPDLFATTTITNVPDSSPLLWAHFVLAVLVVAISHVGISRFEEGFWRRDGGEEGGASVEMFTVMVQGVPKGFASDRSPVEEYFRERYPGKVCRVVVPFDLCRLEGLAAEWEKVTRRIENLEARMGVIDESDGNRVLKTLKEVWRVAMVKLGFGDEERFGKLLNLRSRLAAKLIDYREGHAPGAGIAFVVFRDVYTANKAVRDLRCDRQKTAIGRFFSLVELQLELRRWRVEKAPPASDIYWNHLGSSKLSLRLRRVAVNTCLLLMLLFCSSPLAIITAAKSAARIINAEAVDNAQMWLAWLEGSSWFVTVVLQFLPNVLIFVGMYIVVPSALSYLSKFEKHLTMSGEQRAAMLKMVCFFLVNLILLRVLVESSLENAILSMGRCYLDGADCKRIEQYMSASFLSKSCLSTLAFLIASTFLGISFDLLAPIPWIKKTLKKFSKNDMLQLVPEQNEEYSFNQNLEDPLRMPLVSERRETSPVSSGTDLQGQDLSVYPISRSFHTPKQTFDFAQYYAFNLTIFALTLIYSLFAPLVVPVGATYFGYRYIVDKYNFLFVYRVRGFPPGNDGKLMDSVLCIMHFCVVMFLVAMLFFFGLHGDSMKLQAIFTLGLLVFYKLLPLKSKRLKPSLLEGLQSVDSFIDGRTDYEVFSEPILDWDAYHL